MERKNYALNFRTEAVIGLLSESYKIHCMRIFKWNKKKKSGILLKDAAF